MIYLIHLVRFGRSAFLLGLCLLVMCSAVSAKRNQKKSAPYYIVSFCDTNIAKWIFEDDSFQRLHLGSKYSVEDPSGLWVYRRIDGHESPYPPTLLLMYLITNNPVHSYHFSLGPCDTIRELTKEQLMLVFEKNKRFIDTLKKVRENRLWDIDKRTKRTVLNNLYLSALSGDAVKSE